MEGAVVEDREVRRAAFKSDWADSNGYFDIPLADPPADPAPSDCKEGYDVVTLHSVAKWAETTDFDAIARQVQIDPKSFQYATWAFLDFITGTTWPHYASMDKARALGWDVQFDSWNEGWLPAFEQLKDEGIIPR